MPVLVQSKADDEISDLIARVREATGDEIGVVIPEGSRAFQTPLNARLLRQFSKQSGRQTSIVSDDVHVQQLARMSGFRTFASIPAYERGIELLAPAAPPTTRAYVEDDAAAVAVAPPKPAAAQAAAPPLAPRPAQPPPTTRVTTTETAASGEPPRRNRRWLYIGGAALAVVGIIMFMLLSPSATITMTVAATPLTVNPTIQGSTDAGAAAQGDHVLTQVVSATGQTAFQATPTGQTTLPATAASGVVTITTSGPFPFQGTIPQNTRFQNSDGSIVFYVTQDTFVCLAPNGQPAPTNCQNNGQPAPANNRVPVKDTVPESKGNLGKNSLAWPASQPQPSECQPSYCTFTNPDPTTGGNDQRQVTTASSTDVANWNQQVQQLEKQLTDQLNSDMQSKASGKKFAVDPGGNGKAITFTLTPALPAADAQFSPAQITIAATGSAAVYDPNQVKNVVLADLQALVPQGYQLAPGKLSMQPVAVTLAGTDGTVILSVSATDYSQPQVNIEGLKSQLTGKNPGDAQRIIEGRLDKVQNVQVSEFPFTLPYLPFFGSRIQIVENFVPLSPSS